MGQKTNQNILRLGKTREWSVKYIEKKNNELSEYRFKNLELQKFIYKFFEEHQLSVKCCKISQSVDFLHIFVSYFTLNKIKLLLNQIHSEQKIKTSLKKNYSKKNIEKKRLLTYSILKQKSYKQKYFYLQINQQFKQRNLAINQTNKHYFLNKKFRRVHSIHCFKEYKSIETYHNRSHIKHNLFIKKLFESLSLFLNKKIQISLSLAQINKDNNIIDSFNKKEKKLIAKSLTKLRKFKQSNFFNEGSTLLYNCLLSDNPSELLSKYISTQLKAIKKHNFFLGFLKNTLKIFLKKNFFKTKKIKILIKGRLNGAPRAKKKVLHVGIPPSLTLNLNISYSESTAFTPNGTLGIKIWAYS